ncbi:hypothetical protein H6F42_02815 [Pseudanabaena sp. FACHB-1998]|uniref:DUF7689 domain-containing protein n=1 Tax=Pseudanabaena sp. FACHB-1998 TaxID=2692858 RepID=UPI00168111B8|nr:hypothetical protein [Pseudanabaena sp. FACHB-1998]MBD2175850.1 hypothetical protein [Pseudanabaena sp. FACHB-1998]
MGKAIHLELRFPNLALTEYNVTSPKSQEYNCFAWVAGDQERWWQPTPEDEFYWVEGVPLEETLAAYIQAYQTIGYGICDNAELEAEYEKIALYVDEEGIPVHAAKQLSTGKWSSKLGWLEDIEHELEGLAGERYGNVGQILRRFNSA